jgi:hypothetical protein
LTRTATALDKQTQKSLLQSTTEAVLRVSGLDNDLRVHVETVCNNVLTSQESSVTRMRDLMKLKTSELKKCIRSIA